MLSRKPRFLKTNYKPPKKIQTGRIDIYDPFNHKKELELTKKIDKTVKKQNKRYELSNSDSDSDSSNSGGSSSEEEIYVKNTARITTVNIMSNPRPKQE